MAVGVSLSVVRAGWLVAQEERQNDIFCMRKLSAKAMERLERHQDWPEDFDRYETLLRMGAEAGHAVRFLDPFHSSLIRTTADLARERPGILVSELAYLLNLEPELATAIARILITDEGVKIDFDIGTP